MNGWDWVLVVAMAVSSAFALVTYVAAARYRQSIAKSGRRLSEVSDPPLRQVAIGLGFEHKRSA